MNGLQVGKLFGIPILFHWTGIIMTVLLNLRFGQIVGEAYPNMDGLLVAFISLGISLAVVASVIAHEYGHALVGRRVGVEFNKITIHLLGGAAHMSSGIPGPRGEFWMAIAGPLVSVAIAVLSFGYLILTGVQPKNPSLFEYTVLVTGSVNVGLAVFNMLPAFPMDGGRVLRSAIWKASGSYITATYWATRVGMGFAAFMAVCGVAMAFDIHIPLLGVGLSSAMWIWVLAFFIFNAAKMEWRHA
jgi:Zn-dependent protease